MDDYISRQAAIDAILHITNCKSVRELFEYNQLHHLTEMWSGGVNDAIDAVIGVDSAQLGTNLAEVGTDCISRKQAIDAVTDELDMIDHVPQWVFDRLEKRLKQLPPAQPEPCDDAVSRKAVKDGFVEMCNLICPYTEKQRHAMCGSCLLGTAFDVLEATQSVTPKQGTGKCMWCERLKERNLRIEYYWINEEGCTASFSEPHIVATGIAKFCPNCGAKITEGDAE